jgi:hypothetical protein
MLKRVNSTSNSPRRKVTMSLRRMQGTMASLSHKAVNIGGVMVLGRPAPFDGAFVDPKRRTFRRWWRIARVEQRAILAVWSSVGTWSPCNLLLIMFWVSSCVQTAKFGAILVVESIMDGTMPELTCLILGLPISKKWQPTTPASHFRLFTSGISLLASPQTLLRSA